MSESKQPTPTTAQHLQYWLAKALAFLLRTVPLSWAAAFGRGLGWCFYKLDKRHRQRVQQQVVRAFGGELTEADGRQIAREMYRHFGLMLIEFVRMPLISENDIDKHVDWGESKTVIPPLLAEGKGIIMATGHIGHWEMFGYSSYKAGFITGAIARPLNNPLLDKLVKETRCSGGGQIFDKFGAMRHALRTLKKKEGFGILADQDGGKRGVFVPFFGIPASTIPTVGDMAVRTGAPVMVVAVQRTGQAMQFRYNLRGPIRANPDAPPEAEAMRINVEMNKALESLIREKPAQWLWLHRRWKTPPPEGA